MTWHPTNTEAALGFVALAIGGVLIVWASLRPREPRPKPQPKDEPIQLFFGEAVNDSFTASPALVTATPARSTRRKKRSGRFRDKAGRLHEANGRYVERVKAK